MNKPVSLANARERAWYRGMLLAALEEDEIITSVTLEGDGRFIINKISWETYWKDVLGGFPEADDRIHSLHAAWEKYICSRLDYSLVGEYCHQYFRLLKFSIDAQNNYGEDEGIIRVLSKVTGFENIDIRMQGSEFSAAVTSTGRNPCYLLSKLNKPEASAEDGSYLPIIMVDKGDAGREMYYQYRQHSLSPDSRNHLLLYLSNNLKNRGGSFEVITEFEHRISRGIDPRFSGHAVRIANRVILPYLKKEADDGRDVNVEIMDIGAGRGMLCAKICEELADQYNLKATKNKFRVHMIDLAITHPHRFFSGGKLASRLDTICNMGVDYRILFSRNGDGRVKDPDGIRIGLLSRTLDSFREFRVVFHQEMEEGGNAPSVDGLEPMNLSPENLGRSPRKIPYLLGNLYDHPALSEYYQAIYTLQNPNPDEKPIGRGNYLPYRYLSPDNLYCHDGHSLILEISNRCSILIILDGDLTPETLKEHLKLDQDGSTAYEVTRVMRLKNYHCYILTKDSIDFSRLIGGEKIWPN